MKFNQLTVQIVEYVVWSLYGDQYFCNWDFTETENLVTRVQRSFKFSAQKEMFKGPWNNTRRTLQWKTRSKEDGPGKSPSHIR